jgi:uncharacterized NAD(P)/FAD-binding protein YdhS
MLDEPPVRIAIVGFGPKGLHALERLLDHAAALPPRSRLDVDLFEPDPDPGAGPNYAPGQPSYLRMNYAAELIDVWWPESRAVPRSVQRSFVRWRADGETDAYPPRAQVGAYLGDAFESLLRHAPRTVTIRLRQTPVLAVRANGAGWDVLTAGEHSSTYDEVLIATGHQQFSADALAVGWARAAPLVPRVFPVDRWLAPDVVAAGARVAIRGFGLTFIDVAIALTEGRGGAFDALGHPYRLRYTSAPDAVQVIVPFSRTGRVMLAKPDPLLALDVHELETIAALQRKAVLALTSPVSLVDEVIPILARTTTASLLAVGHGHEEDPGAWFARAADGSLADPGLEPVEQLERSLAVGAGLAPPGLLWAVGHSWRALYPALVERLGDGGLCDEDWPAFHRLAAEMERVAFGPSPINAAKLLALVDAGVVDLSAVAGGRLRDRDGRTFVASGLTERPVDVVVDAVLPGPGAQSGQDPLLDGLIADGHARVAVGRRGLDVDGDGSCRAIGGAPSRGLAAIGRPTEDSVIGNDTLGRTLHPLSDRWARRVVERQRADRAVPHECEPVAT